MIHKTGRVLAVVLMSFLLITTVAFAAGNDRAGTASGTQLLIPVGARYLAVGGSAAAFSEGVESIWYNPAGLSRMSTSAGVMFSYMPYIADIGVSYGAIGVKSGFGTFGVAIKALNIGDIPVTTEKMPDGTGENFTPTFFIMGVTFSKQLTDQVSAGATVNVINERMGRVSASGMAIDVGIQYRNLGGVEGLNTGIVVKNLGPSLQYGGTGLYREANDYDSKKSKSYLSVNAATFDLPSTMDMSLSYTKDVGELGNATLSYLFQNNNFSDDISAIGGEFAYQDMAFLRVGYSMAPDKAENSEYLYGLTFGAGVLLKTGNVELSVDYAYRQVEFFDNSNIVSVKLGF